MRKTKTRIRILCTLLFLLPFLSACEFKDIDKVIFVTAIGVDKTDNSDNPIRITLKMFIPTASLRDQPSPEYAFASMEGESFSEVLRILETHSDKQIEFGHAKLIILGEDVLEHDVEGLLDYVIRRSDIQLISWVAVARPTAKEVLEFVPKTESSSIPSLYNYFDTIGNESAYVVTTFLYDFRRKVLSEGIDPVLPIIEMNHEESQYEINKSIVLMKDQEPLELTPNDCKIYNTLTHQARETDILVKDKGYTFMSMIDEYQANYNATFNENRQATLEIDLDLVGTIIESKTDLHKKNLPKYSELAEDTAKKYTKEFINKLKKAGADPLGFGLHYKASKLHTAVEFDKWKEAYKDSELKLNINVSLKSTGTIQ